jgi:hypothetical protein
MCVSCVLFAAGLATRRLQTDHLYHDHSTLRITFLLCDCQVAIQLHSIGLGDGSIGVRATAILVSRLVVEIHRTRYRTLTTALDNCADWVVLVDNVIVVVVIVDGGPVFAIRVRVVSLSSVYYKVKLVNKLGANLLDGHMLSHVELSWMRNKVEEVHEKQLSMHLEDRFAMEERSCRQVCGCGCGCGVFVLNEE